MKERFVLRTQDVIGRLKKRSDFLNAAKGRKSHSALFTVQGMAKTSGQSCSRIGFTVTKKVGNAVERNRIRRRLRELVRVIPNLGVHRDFDYVLVARRDAIRASFSRLESGLKAAVRKIHTPSSAAPRQSSRVAPDGGSGT